MATNKPEGEADKPITKSEVKAAIKAIADRLARTEGQKHSGAKSRTPKARMLDASDIEKKHKDRHYLYVNTDDPGNLQTHIDDGYVAVSEDEAREAGVRQRVGETVLMHCPQEDHEERVEQNKKKAADRLQAPKREFQQAMEGIVGELRSRGYSDHDIGRMLVDE